MVFLPDLTLQGTHIKGFVGVGRGLLQISTAIPKVLKLAPSSHIQGTWPAENFKLKALISSVHTTHSTKAKDNGELLSPHFLSHRQC